jgi:hypothetical protein
MAGQQSASDSQFLPGQTIGLAPYLRLSAAPYGQTSIPISVIQCSDNLQSGVFVTDFVTLYYGLCFFYNYLKTSRLKYFLTSPNFGSFRFLTGYYPFTPYFHSYWP